MSRMSLTPLPTRLVAILPLLLLVLGGCETTSRVREVAIDAIRRPAPAGEPLHSYELRTRDARIDERSLRHREAATHVKTALSGRGLYEAPENVPPDMVIEVDYGIESSGFRYEIITVPVYASPDDPVHIIAKARAGPTAAREPGSVLIGYREIAQPIATTEKYLSISARPVAAGNADAPPPQIWRVDARIDDEGDDLRNCLPVLASAAMNQIGRDTGGETTLRVAEDDPSVEFIREGL